MGLYMHSADGCVFSGEEHVRSEHNKTALHGTWEGQVHPVQHI